MSVLQDLGISEVEERVYRSIVSSLSPRSPSDLKAATGLSGREVWISLQRLEKEALIARACPTRNLWQAVSPDVALAALIGRRKRQLESAGAWVIEFAERYRAVPEEAPTKDGLVQVLRGREEIERAYLQLHRGAVQDFLAFATPPYLLTAEVYNAIVSERHRCGVRYRTIYDRAILEEYGSEWAHHVTEEVRFKDVPSKLALVDGQIALLPLGTDDSGLDARVLVRAPSLVKAVAMAFELAWKEALPPSRPSCESPPESFNAQRQRLLELLASGLQDTVIAARLNVSVRTARRRVHALLEELGAETRFEAGVQAARRGWL